MFWAIGLIMLKMDIRLERNKEDRKMLTSEQIVELERQFNDYSFHRILNEKIGYYEDSFIFMGKMGALRIALDTLGYIVNVEKIDEKHGIKYKYYRLYEKVNKEK